MKTNYVTPQIEVIEIEVADGLLQTSTQGSLEKMYENENSIGDW